MNQRPFVSIIIPMYNAAATIEACLDGLFKLDYPKDRFEVIIVDNNSTDDSPMLASRYPVKVLHKAEGTIAAVRNFGAKAAKGDVYGFVDSDCVVKEDWIASALDVLSNPQVAAAGSNYLRPENCSWVEEAWLYESKYKPFETDFVPCGNFIVKASVFNAIGGFNERLTTCEDAEIGIRITQGGHKLINSSAIRSIHLRNPKTIAKFVKNEIWHGTNMVDTFRLNYMDKALIMTVLFFLAHIGVLAGFLLLTVFNGGAWLFLISLAFLLAILSSSTLYRIKRSRKYHMLFHTMCLYYFYFVARTIALINSILNGMRMNSISAA